MSDVDMRGKVVAITGANSGIGRATASAIAGMGATVLACGRDRTKLHSAVNAIRSSTGNDRVVPLVADLSSMSDVRSLAAEILSQHERLDVLINNAGVGVDRRMETVDGYELMMAVNHLAPFLLTKELLPRLIASAPARIVTVSSANHVSAKAFDLDDLQSRGRFNWNDVYARSKLANILFTRALSRRLEGTGVTANSLHPGVIATGFGDDGDLGGFNAVVFRVLKWFLSGPEKGARTSVFLATSPEVSGISGRYFANCKEATPSPLAQDDRLAEELWNASEALVEAV